jgi:6-phosphofructokinase
MSLSSSHVNVAMMTSGGLAPCLSSSVAQLVHYWSKALKDGKISSLTFRMYIDGYKGILTGDSFLLPEETWEQCDALNYLGGSPIGNSRVKVCNAMDDTTTLNTIRSIYGARHLSTDSFYTLFISLTGSLYLSLFSS